ncbi:cytochrome P450, partial [Mycena leptocephala]
RQAYEEALAKHGPVIGVWRKGRLEYVVDKQYAKEVLSQEDIFSFEDGAFEFLNLGFLHFFNGRKFFRDVEDLVLDGVARPLKEVTDRIRPIIERRVQEYVNRACEDQDGPRAGTDFKDFCHQVVVENMVFLTFGKVSFERKICKMIKTLENDLAIMMGMFQNTSFFSRTFPGTWKFFVRIRVLFFSVLPGFLFVLGSPIWSAIDAFEDSTKHNLDGFETNIDGVVQLLAKKWIDPQTGRVTLLRRLWIVAIFSGFVFSSVHNTTIVTTWVMYELARRPEYLQPIRDELMKISGNGDLPLTSASLKAATLLDLFIREVLRLKGDTLSQIRRTTCDAPLGKYIIPQGQLVIPLATTVHKDFDVYGDSASTFDGFRWVQQEKPAVMIGPSYIPFGLGRFACPGRGLAITEVKLVILAFIAKATPTLENGSYQITDPMNTAAVAPSATLLVGRLHVPLD